jgi:two-component system sensor histidine kinase RegB
MGRQGKDDRLLHAAPVPAVVREAAEPHLDRGKALHVAEGPVSGDPRQPVIQRHPEVIHGLRNLIQNAVDFARANVWVDILWTADSLRISVADDGPGYPSHLLGRIGDPFIRPRRDEDRGDRPAYEGMGLGLFIAKTLLERTGARLTFGNGADQFLAPDERPERCGAIVDVTWPRAVIEVPGDLPLGENREFSA